MLYKFHNSCLQDETKEANINTNGMNLNTLKSFFWSNSNKQSKISPFWNAVPLLMPKKN